MARKTKTRLADDQAPRTETVAPDAAADTPASPRTPRPGSKLAQVLTLLAAPEGTTIPELMEATGWQSHTVRGALAGVITRKLGRTITSQKVEGRGRVYRVERPSA